MRGVYIILGCGSRLSSLRFRIDSLRFRVLGCGFWEFEFLGFGGMRLGFRGFIEANRLCCKK